MDYCGWMSKQAPGTKCEAGKRSAKTGARRRFWEDIQSTWWRKRLNELANVRQRWTNIYAGVAYATFMESLKNPHLCFVLSVNSTSGRRNPQKSPLDMCASEYQWTKLSHSTALCFWFFNVFLAAHWQWLQKFKVHLIITWVIARCTFWVWKETLLQLNSTELIKWRSHKEKKPWKINMYVCVQQCWLKLPLINNKPDTLNSSLWNWANHVQFSRIKTQRESTQGESYMLH